MRAVMKVNDRHSLSVAYSLALLWRGRAGVRNDWCADERKARIEKHTARFVGAHARTITLIQFGGR